MSDNAYVTKEEFESYKKEAKKEFGKKKEKKTRAPNAYNLFMKDEVARLKGEKPGLSNQEAFKMGAANWKKQKEEKATSA